MNAQMPNCPLEVRDADGRLVGYFVSPDELARLREENDTLRRHLKAVLPVATPEQEAEFRRQLDTGVWLDGDQVIAELTAELGDGNDPK